jgi:predicted esterase
MKLPRLLLLALAAGAAAAGPDEREPGPASKGKVFQWKSPSGIVCEYFVPGSYDPARGANLTLILHGSNLDHRWGFANHPAGKFRPDDVVVCPDGTTPNGKGGFNSLQSAGDLEKLHALHADLRKRLKVRATFLYGHSQGSFFAFLYAGAYPDEVQGVLGQASGVWIGTQATKKHHHQAIALMHGTADPVVPYGQSVGGLKFYRDARYPLCRLRSLEGWNHWPEAQQAAQELAWCEGMITTDPARAVAAFDELREIENGARDFAALADVARRLRDLEGAPADARRRAGRAAAAVERLAAKHAEALARASPTRADTLEEAPWVGHLPLFLRDFDGLPAQAALARDWAEPFERHRKNADKHLREFWRQREKEPAKAFPAGVAAIKEGFLAPGAADAGLLAALEEWRGRSGPLKLPKAAVKEYDGVVVRFLAARKAGLEAFRKLNGGFREE